MRERLADQPGNARLRQPFGQRIDRLAKPRQQAGAFGLDMVGMNDLQHLAILIEPTRDPAQFTHWQELFCGIGRAPEIGQRADIAEIVGRQNTVRPTPR